MTTKPVCLFMYLFICLSLYLPDCSICLSVSVFTNMYLWMSIYMWTSVHLSIHMYIYLSIHIIDLSVHPSVCQSIYLLICPSVGISAVTLWVFLSVCPSVCTSLCLSVYLLGCLTVCISICLPVSLSVRLPNCLSINLSVWPSVYSPICVSVYIELLGICLNSLKTNNYNNGKTIFTLLSKRLQKCFMSNLL